MTLEVVLFPDVELWATGAIRAALAARAEPYTDDVYVGISSPVDPNTGQPVSGGRVVTVRRDGGPRDNVALESARVGVNVLADTEQDCNDLARMVSALLWASAGTGTVKRVDITSGPTTIPDDRPHKYLTADIVQKGVSS